MSRVRLAWGRTLPAALRALAIVAACFLLGVGTAWGGPVEPPDPLAYLLNLGPIGALVWGAYWLGKGVKLTIVVELSEEDRRLFTERRPVAA